MQALLTKSLGPAILFYRKVFKKVKYKKFIFLLVLFAGLAFGGKKISNRNWETGKLIDVDLSQNLAGIVTMPDHKITLPVYNTSQILTIETDSHQYVVIVRRVRKLPNITVNSPLKFALEGNIIYFLDSDGREYTTEVMKKILR